MTIVKEFYANTKVTIKSVTMVTEKYIWFDAATINRHFNIQSLLHDDMTNMDSTVDLYKVTKMIYGEVVNWTVVMGTCTSFLTKESVTDMTIWHHFICAKLIPTSYLTEVTRERALLLYAIAKNLSINVGF